MMHVVSDSEITNTTYVVFVTEYVDNKLSTKPYEIIYFKGTPTEAKVFIDLHVQTLNEQSVRMLHIDFLDLINEIIISFTNFLNSKTIFHITDIYPDFLINVLLNDFVVFDRSDKRLLQGIIPGTLTNETVVHKLTKDDKQFLIQHLEVLLEYIVSTQNNDICNYIKNIMHQGFKLNKDTRLQTIQEQLLTKIKHLDSVFKQKQYSYEKCDKVKKITTNDNLQPNSI